MIQNFPSDIIAVQWKKNVEGFLEHVKDFVSSWLKNMDPDLVRLGCPPFFTFGRPV